MHSHRVYNTCTMGNDRHREIPNCQPDGSSEPTRVDYPPDDVLKFSLRSPSCPVYCRPVYCSTCRVPWWSRWGRYLIGEQNVYSAGYTPYTHTAAAVAARSVLSIWPKVILFFSGCSPYNVIICMPPLLIMSGSGPCLIPRHRRVINCQSNNLPK